MGWFAKDAWGAAVAQQLSALKPDQVSKPFQTEAGWHIIELLGTRQADRTDEIARNQARQAIGNRKAEQAYDDFLRQLKASAYIKILVPSLRDPSQKDDDDNT